MAESVQAHLEDMSEEIQELRKLFSSEETKFIQKKRESLEYKINGYCRSLQDIQDYINHERYFLRQVAIRRHKRGVYSQRRHIEHKVIGRVKTLYEKGMNLKHDYAFSLSYFKFCKLYGYHDVAKIHIKNMTEKFSYKPEVWQIAAAFFREISKKESQFIVNRGLQFHKENKPLFLDAINLELESVVSAEGGGNYTVEIVCERLKKYCEVILKNVKDFTFWLEVLKVLQSHKFTKQVQDMIVKELLEKYSNEESVWQCLAERERDGFHYEFVSESNNKETKELTLEDCLKRCIDTYERGLTKVRQGKKSELWLLYLDTLIGIHNSNKSSKIKAELLQKFEAANKEITLEEKHYVAWMECCKDDKAVARVLEKATSSLPSSCILWQIRLKYFIKKDSKKEVDSVFEDAIKNLKERSEPIWMTYIVYNSLRSKEDRIKSIYLRGLSEPEPISSVLKPAYIEWLALNLGISEARTAYKEIASQKPYSKELHMMMSKLESYEDHGPDNFDQWGRSLELACQQFAKSDTDVYINYIMFYHKHYNSFDSNKRIQQIYEDAQKNLPEILFAEFKEKYSNLMDRE